MPATPGTTLTPTRSGLALDGTTRPTKGALSMAIAAAEDKNLRGLVVPAESAAEAAVVEGTEVVAVQSLAQAVAFLAGEIEIEPTPSRLDDLFRELANYEVDFCDVRGHEMAKRAIIVAAAGGRNLLILWSNTPSFVKPLVFLRNRRKIRFNRRVNPRYSHVERYSHDSARPATAN